MPDDNRDNPYVPLAPIEEETQKPLRNSVTGCCWSCLTFMGVVPLLLAFHCLVFFHTEYGYDLLCWTIGSSLFIGFPASIVALFISVWQRQFKLAFPSLILMVCNLLLFAYTFWLGVIISC